MTQDESVECVYRSELSVQSSSLPVDHVSWLYITYLIGISILCVGDSVNYNLFDLYDLLYVIVNLHVGLLYFIGLIYIYPDTL